MDDTDFLDSLEMELTLWQVARPPKKQSFLIGAHHYSLDEVMRQLRSMAEFKTRIKDILEGAKK